MLPSCKLFLSIKCIGNLLKSNQTFNVFYISHTLKSSIYFVYTFVRLKYEILKYSKDCYVAILKKVIGMEKNFFKEIK